MPIIHSNYLNSDLNWSDYEFTIKKKYLKWEEMTIDWSSIDLTWDEIFILLEVQKKRGGGGQGSPYRAEDSRIYRENNPWKQVSKDMGEDVSKKLVKIFCKINGVEYNKHKDVFNEIKININDFDRIINESISVKIDFPK